MAQRRDPAAVQELSWSQMYNRCNSNPKILDFRPAEEFNAGHLHICDRIDVGATGEELNSVVRDQIRDQMQRNQTQRHCIMLLTPTDWMVHSARIMEALALSPRFLRYHRCHCFSETLSFAPFLASEAAVAGVPSLIECLLPARVFLSGISYASPAIASQLHLGRIINVTPEVPRCPELTASFPIEDKDAEDIAPVLQDTRPIIAACVRDSIPILIHCHQGVSRSASVVIDYAASALGISADAAMDLVRRSRSIVQPNDAFMARLREMHPPI